MSAIAAQKDLFDEGSRNNVEFDDFTTSSILEFLNKERECFDPDDGSEIDVESLFEEINRLSDNTDDRSVEEILREAEILINKQDLLSGCGKSECENGFRKIVEDVHPDSVISDESTPKDMKSSKAGKENDESDQIDEITENIESIRLSSDEDKSTSQAESVYEVTQAEEHKGNHASIPKNLRECNFDGCDLAKRNDAIKPDPIQLENEITGENEERSEAVRVLHDKSKKETSNDDRTDLEKENQKPHVFHTHEGPGQSNTNGCKEIQRKRSELREQVRKLKQGEGVILQKAFKSKRSSIHLEELCVSQIKRPEKYLQRRASCETNVALNETFTRPRSVQGILAEKSYCDRSTNSSPVHSVDANTSPIENISITREHLLKHEIEQLQEKLKDTEERLQSLRIQHDSLSQLHRDLRESHTHLQEESELLKLDVQHLTECANILRSELHSARNDRNEALEVQKILQSELEESRSEKKRAQEQRERDAKTIQDLQRQCKEMERILMRKHPDSVSALIVASKHPSKANGESSASRRLLEQRIAQLESDAKEQDLKAQKILANVQARFNSVQSKYETHIADLETQVLSLQEINTKLNEKINSQILTLNNFSKNNNNLVNHCTQTDDIAERETTRTSTTCTQTDSTSRPNSSLRQAPPIKKSSGKMSVSHSDTTISGYHAAAKEDAHLLATIRGMRVDLAIKEKAMQRLTRELEECKKTIKKLQKERDAMKSDRTSSASSSSSSRKTYDPTQYVEHSADGQALKEALNKIKLLEFDYKSLHDKRLQDLKTLQAAHERELASCHETVRILQQRLAERDEAFSNQKRRKVPIDYYALKAKVSSLERRHLEREQRLHMLVEALSKGRLNGALEEMLTDNNQ